MKKDDLEKLRQHQQELESEYQANENELQGLDPEVNKDKWHELAQRNKGLGEEIRTNQPKIEAGGKAVEAAKEAAAKEEVRKAGEQLKSRTIEAGESDMIRRSSLTDYTKSDSSAPNLGETTKERIEGIQQGQGNNYENPSQQFGNDEVSRDSLDKYLSSTPNMQVEQDKQKDQQLEPEIERDDD